MQVQPACKYRVASVTSRGIPVPSSRQLQERSQWTPHATQEVTNGGPGDRELVPHLHLEEIGRQHLKHKLLEGEHILVHVHVYEVKELHVRSRRQ